MVPRDDQLPLRHGSELLKKLNASALLVVDNNPYAARSWGGEPDAAVGSVSIEPETFPEGNAPFGSE